MSIFMCRDNIMCRIVKTNFYIFVYAEQPKWLVFYKKLDLIAHNSPFMMAIRVYP
jgi:hypothetical protein